MGKNIFETWAMRYFECGIPVIPLNGKVPLVRDWQEWSKRAQTEDEIESLIARFPHANIGAVLGLWASAIDIDTDNDDVLRALPYSPFRRRGKTGVVILCEPNAHPSQSPDGFPIEFLNHGRQIVLPPSIHPESGEPYMWVGEGDILKIGAGELPAYHPAILDNLKSACTRAKAFRQVKAKRFDGESPALLSNIGRNNKLTAMAYAMACDSIPIPDGAARLLSYDKKEHSPPWFEDPTEPHKGASPEKAASVMYKRAVAKATKLGHVRPPIELKIDLSAPRDPHDSWRPYPQPRGIMRAFVDYCSLTSKGSQDALGLGGAIVFISTLISNRFYTEFGSYDVWPNLFLINLAHSGFGKETAQKTLQELLFDSGLVGSSNYKSGTSILMHLPEQQERVDIIDECSQFLRSMSSKEDYKSEIVEILSSLYSKASSRFLGMASRAEGTNFGACWNPCVNILASTTPAGFRESVNKDMAAKGLMPRFMVFYQKIIGNYSINENTAQVKGLYKSLAAFTKTMLSVPKRVHPEYSENLASTDKSIRYQPEMIPITEAAYRELRLLDQHYFDEGRKDPESFESAFKNRFTQHIVKLSLIDAISQGLGEISIDSVEWARDVVETQWHNMSELYAFATAENTPEKDLIRCRALVDAAGQLSKSQFIHKTRWLFNSRQRDDILKTLQDMDAIRIVKTTSKNHLGRPLEVIVSSRTGAKDLLT